MSLTALPQAKDLQKTVRIPIQGVILQGDLCLPSGAEGMVLFAHGSGSSRKSPRNQFVTRVIADQGIGTLLFDLLNITEELAKGRSADLQFDMNLLASRLVAVTQWVQEHPACIGLPIGYFGASTGGGAALMAAARIGSEIKAVVSRSGRPDLAGEALPKVLCPTLLIVGGYDDAVIAMNEQAFKRLRCEKEMRLVPRATHLFAEPGALDQVAQLSAAWFCRHLAQSEKLTEV